MITGFGSIESGVFSGLHGTRVLDKHRSTCVIFNSAALTIPTGAGWTALTFDSENFDNDNMHSTSTNTGRITINHSGVYLLTAKVRWASNSTSYRDLHFFRNGTYLIASKMLWPNIAVAWPMTLGYLGRLNAGDYVETRGRIGSASGSVDIEAQTNLTPYVSATRLKDSYYCSVSNNAAIAIGDNARTALTFNTDNYDPNDMHSTSSNTSRIVAPVPGWYVAFGQARWAANTTGFREIRTALNGPNPDYVETGSGSYSTGPTTSIITQVQMLTTIYMSANDYLELIIGQNSGGNLNIQSSADGLTPVFKLARLSV